MSRLRGVYVAGDFPGDLDEAARNSLDTLFESVFPQYFKRAGAPEGAPLPSSWALLTRNPELALLVAKLSDYIFHDMPWGQREDLRQLMIQTLNQHFMCDFAFHMHMEVSKRAGISAEMQAALPFWRTSSLFNHEQRDVIAFTQAALAGTMTDELFARAVTLFGEKQTLEFTVAIAYLAFWAILLNTWQPQLDDAYAPFEATDE